MANIAVVPDAPEAAVPVEALGAARRTPPRYGAEADAP